MLLALLHHWTHLTLPYLPPCLSRCTRVTPLQDGESADLRRICTYVLQKFMGRERLRNFGTALHRLAASLGERTRDAAAFKLQLAWRRFCDREVQKNDELYKLIRNKNLGSVGRSFTRSRARRASSESAGAVNASGRDAAIERIEQNLARLEANVLRMLSEKLIPNGKRGA